MPRVVVFPEAQVLAVGDRVVTWGEEVTTPYESFARSLSCKTIPDYILEAGEKIQLITCRGFRCVKTVIDVKLAHFTVTLNAQPHHNFVRRIRAVQQMWRERRKRLAFMTGLHQRLGADSVLLNLDEGVLKMCCFP